MTERKVRVGQLGVGYWGPNLLRNLVALPSVEVVAVADVNPERLDHVREHAPHAEATTNPDSVLGRGDVDAVVIATPADTHVELTRRALAAGKHVLVEKPLALSVEEGEEVVALAEKSGLTLMVGHTFLYNAAVRRLKEYVQGDELGEVLYLYSQRLNLGRVRQDLNSMWNFAPHDVSIILYLLERMPVEVSARGFSYLQPGVEDVVFMTLIFSGGLAAHVHISWLDPQKVRRMTVIGDQKMAVYDDVSSDAKIALYDRRVDQVPTAESPRDFEDFAEFQLLPRRGDVVIPSLPFPEPLRVECEHFVNSLVNDTEPLTNGRNGLDVIRVLEAAERSLGKKGTPEPVVR